MTNTTSGTTSGTGVSELDDLRQRKVMFDITWTLATALATLSSVLCWYFRWAQVDIAPILWTLVGLSFLQLALSVQTRRIDSCTGLRWTALSSQLLGTVLMGIAWHLFGGLQQPVFPLFIALPLLPGALLLGFWQQQAAIVAFLLVLTSGVLLSPDGNSFISQRDELGRIVAHVLPDWVPRTRVIFPDVNTSPTFDTVLMAAVAVVGVAMSTAARALASLHRHTAEHLRTLGAELIRERRLNTELIAHSPCSEVLVASATGRIVKASEAFASTFGIADPVGRFLLDTVAFSYPSVIRRLLETGGDDIQGATFDGRDVILRVRARLLGDVDSRTTLLIIESHEGLCWRGEVDALDEPAFAISARGSVLAANRAARELFGETAEGEAATHLFDAGGAAWWNIAPLDSTRRLLDRDGHRYLVAIRRARIADSIGEMSFVRVYPHAASAQAA